MIKTKDQLKLEVVTKIEARVMSRSEGKIILRASDSTLKRFIKAYREKGIGFLRHGNCLRKPVNKLPEQLKTDVQRLVKEKYYDFNMLHAAEKIKEELGVTVPRETFRQWCHEIGMVKRAKKRRSKPRYKRERMPQPGLFIQMDGSHHQWFGGRKTCLIAAIDDANSEVVHGEFFESETTLACLQVLKKIVEKKGIFKVLYVDRAGCFGGIKRSNFSQVERALGEIGVQIIYAHSPEAKGRIERLFGTLQDRLVPEMRLNKIRTIEQANEYIQTAYLPHQHNPRFSVLATNPVSAYIPLHPTVDLKNIFCLKEYRIVGRDHTISFASEKYVIADELKYSIHKQRIEMRYDHENDRWKAFFAERKLTLVKVKQVKRGAAAA